MKPYKSTVPPTDSAEHTTTDVDVPTRDQIAHRMAADVQNEPDAHKRAHARAQLIKFLMAGQEIAGRAAREKAKGK